MPFETALTGSFAGYALTSARGPGEHVQVVYREFVSSEDGNLLISRLEGLPSALLAEDIKPSSVDHLVAIIRPDRTAKVFINELRFLAQVVAKNDVEAGSNVYLDDIADIRSLAFDDKDGNRVKFPDDCGVAVVFSHQWRKGFYFDIGPIFPLGPIKREYDVEILLGQYYSNLMFQQRLSLSEEDWSFLIQHRWFPFTSLSHRLLTDMVNHAREKWSFEQLTVDIHNYILQGLDNFAKRWQAHSYLVEYWSFLEKAISHFKGGDYISTCMVLYPVIEGVMRRYAYQTGVSNFRQSSLARVATSYFNSSSQVVSLLFPHKFTEFLEKVYFASFEPSDIGNALISRNSIGHGVASVNDFSPQTASLGLLIVDQLAYYMRSDK